MKILKKLCTWEREQAKNPGTALSLGMATGIAIGVAMDNIGVGVALGVAIGVGIHEESKACSTKKNDKDKEK